MKTRKVTDLAYGSTLPNGATVLFYSLNERGEGVVMAEWEGNCQPFVTWDVYDNNPKSTSTGHYFKAYEDCYADYLERRK